MTRAPRDPAKLALSKERRDDANASVVMADKTAVPVYFNYIMGAVVVSIRAVDTTWANGKRTFTLETQNSLNGDGFRYAEEYPNLESLVKEAERIKVAFAQQVEQHLAMFNGSNDKKK